MDEESITKFKCKELALWKAYLAENLIKRDNPPAWRKCEISATESWIFVIV
jgi:hypothetical protein